MSHNALNVLHLIFTIVMAGCGVASWRIYFRYQKSFGPNVSVFAMMQRLREAKNPDGTWFLVESVVGIAAGLGLFVLLFIR